MSDSLHSSFMRGIFSIGFGRFMNQALGMLSLMLVIRHISAEAYGVFVLIRVMNLFLAEVSNLGLSLVIPKYLASNEDVQHKIRLINTVIYFRVLTILACGSLIFVVKPVMVFLFGSSPLFLSVFIYLPIIFALESLARTLNSILQGLFRFRMLGIISTLSAVVNFIATIVFVLFLNLSTLGLIYALIVSSTLSIIMAYLTINIKDKLRINIPILKEMLIFGFPLQVQYMLDFVFSRLDTMIIGFFLGTASVAYYEVARKLPDSFMYLYDAFRSVFYPFIAKLHADQKSVRLVKLLNNSNRVLSFVTSLGALLAMLFGNEIISLLFSQKYLPSYYAFVILMFGLNLSVLDNTLGYSLVAIGEPTKPLVVNIVRAIISMLLNLVITPIFGFIGASVVAVVSNLVAAPLDVYFLWKRDVRAEIAAFVKPVIISACYCVLFFLLGASLLPIKILFVFLFILTCILTSVITRKDWRGILAEG